MLMRKVCAVRVGELSVRVRRWRSEVVLIVIQGLCKLVLHEVPEPDFTLLQASIKST